MKKLLLLLLFIPLVSVGQDVNINEYYDDGKKLKVKRIENRENGINVIIIEGEHNIESKNLKWGMAKDAVTPQDIFRLTDEGPEGRAKVAKYCYQDCNLVHNLFIKNDIFTAMVEQAAICSVPIEFVAMRGQGIKLLSFIAKEARNAGMLIPVLEKFGNLDDCFLLH